ncbi:uncharacterized protein BT62DRAFT_1075266 [Guyanagaster necrorhizus]|uniref:Uncharacterized protein n=1 Tax=Guyanagaster necrorhizus TaxID=856835 RepID=A0A9P7VVZ7_9AGAR|nr:uncharacterized protein BT62DRAFT_1075266 [Guyanagaster necrorhizus MCA 3950]KAG7447179.1 hypothetical protein BT62DRAFT_1075266 [Guyanagaster necrorhizus MCA 3950]
MPYRLMDIVQKLFCLALHQRSEFWGPTFLDCPCLTNTIAAFLPRPTENTLFFKAQPALNSGLKDLPSTMRRGEYTNNKTAYVETFKSFMREYPEPQPQNEFTVIRSRPDQIWQLSDSQRSWRNGHIHGRLNVVNSHKCSTGGSSSGNSSRQAEDDGEKIYRSTHDQSTAAWFCLIWKLSAELHPIPLFDHLQGRDTEDYILLRVWVAQPGKRSYSPCADKVCTDMDLPGVVGM